MTFVSSSTLAARPARTSGSGRPARAGKVVSLGEVEEVLALVGAQGVGGALNRHEDVAPTGVGLEHLE